MANIFSGLKTIQDYQNSADEFQARKDAAAQQLQSGNLDALSKKNIYATQVLSGAAATGNQANYDIARQHLMDNGIDVSPWAADIATGAKQAQAAKLSQSPFGALLNSMSTFDKNAVTAGAATGNVPDDPNANARALLQGAMPGAFQPTSSPAQPVQPVQPINNAWKNPDAIQPPINNTVTSAPLPPIGSTIKGQSGAEAAAAQLDAKYPGQANTGTFPVAAPVSSPQSSGIPVQGRTETTAHYESRPEVAAYKEKLKVESGETGKALGEAQKSSTIMRANMPMVLQRFEEMRKASANAGYGSGNDAEGNGWLQEFHKNFANSPTAEANAILKQYAAQGILPELGPQLLAAGVKGNKFVEQVASASSGLDLSANPASKIKIANGLENNFINNFKSTQAQLRTNGLPALSDDEVDSMVADIKKGKFAGAQNPTVGQPPQNNVAKPTLNTITPTDPRIAAARAAGYSEQEIVNYLGGK